MKKFLFLLTLALLSLLCSDAHAQYIPVTASSCIVDGSGSVIVAGTMTVIGTDGNDNPIPYRAGGSFMTTTAPIVKSIINGTVTGFNLADPANTSPTNVQYRFTVQDNLSKRNTLYKGIVITPNDAGGTVFNFCKMNPLPGVSSAGVVSVPSLVSGDWTVSRDLFVARNFGMTSLGVATSGSPSFGPGPIVLNGSNWNGSAAIPMTWNITCAPASIASAQNGFCSFSQQPLSSTITDLFFQLNNSSIAATASVNWRAPKIQLNGTYWTGTTTGIDSILWNTTYSSTGANPIVTHALQHSGSTGGLILDLTGALNVILNGIDAPETSGTIGGSTGRGGLWPNSITHLWGAKNNNGTAYNLVGDTTAQTLSAKTLASPLFTGTESGMSITDTMPIKRLKATNGTSLIAGDFAISGGWGTTASIGSILGSDAGFSFIVTSNGTGQAAGPTVTLTFHDGTWTNSPICVVSMGPGNSALSGWLVSSVSATQLVLQGTLVSANLTPVAGNTYGGSAHCQGRG